MRLAAPVLLAAVVLAGCGGDDPEGEPPERWAADVCGALEQWQETLENQQQELSANLNAIESLSEGKRELIRFLDVVTADTDEMLADLDRAGRPAVEDGAALRRDMRRGLRRIKTAFEQARSRAEQVETDDPQQFQRDLGRIAEQLTARGEAVEETFDELDSKYDVPELDEAFDDNPSCRALETG